MADADILVGQNFGGYEILEEIGRGGMAVVYKARQISMNRLVAVKVLPQQFVHDQTFRARFEREVRIVAQLEHRAIVPVHDYGEVDEQPYIVMRFMDAGSVDDLLEDGVLPPGRVERIVSHIADALDYAHSRPEPVLHRDLKPSNILLDEAGDAYLTDFGIAHLTGSVKITQSGVVGTPAYMSPEQAQGLKLDGRSDVYGLAVVTFEMLCGRRPYESDTPYGIAVMHVTAPVPSIRDFNPALSPAIDRALQRGMAKNRAERFQTAAAFAQALSKAVHATADEVAESIAPTRPVDLDEAQRRMTEYEAAHVSAPVRGAQPDVTAPPLARPQRSSPPTPHSRSNWVQQPVQPGTPTGTPPGTPAGTPAGTPPGLPTGSGPVPRRRRRSRLAGLSNLMLYTLIGGAIGCVIFGVLALLALTVLNTGTPATATETPTPTGGTPQVTVIPPLSALHPAAQVLTATAAAAGTVTVEADQGVDPLSALSGANAQLIFFAERNGGDAELYWLDLDSGLEQPLTDNSADDSYPAVSPDGAWLAFVSSRDGDSEIYVMDLSCLGNGSAAGVAAACAGMTTQLTFNETEDRTPAWTPDGETIIYSADVDGDGEHNLFRMTADGRDVTRLTNSDTSDRHPSVSPDGRYVLFHAWIPGEPETGRIRRLDLETGNIVTLIDNEGADWSPVYSPDGRRIVFIRRGEGDAAVWVANADGRAPLAVYDSSGYDWGAAWSPDGGVLAFTSNATGDYEIYLIDAAGGPARRITTGGGAYPVWIP
ncbi:MAG: PD40 domain-containing protein [Anaerolineae bacterium]|nr:PD40 domain-containing protein [Anaerolineae bacterium]